MHLNSHAYLYSSDIFNLISISHIFGCDMQVVYAIMHRQEVLLPFRNHPRFSELLENIFTVRIHPRIFQFWTS